MPETSPDTDPWIKEVEKCRTHCTILDTEIDDRDWYGKKVERGKDIKVEV